MTCIHPVVPGTELFKTTGDIERMWHLQFENTYVHVLITRSPHNPERKCVEIFERNERQMTIPIGGEYYESFYLERNDDPDNETWPEHEIICTVKDMHFPQTLGIHGIKRLNSDKMIGGVCIADMDEDTLEDALRDLRQNDVEAREILEEFPLKNQGRPTCCHPTMHFLAVGNALYSM